MKNNYLLLIAAAAVAASCSDTLKVNTPVEDEGAYVTIEQPDVVSTKGLAYNDGIISFAWESGEQLMVYGATNSAAIFTINESGTSVAKLESPDFQLNDGKEYYVYSPVSGTLSSADKNAVNVSFSGQRQIANTDTKHLSLNQYACAVGKVENNTINFQLYNQVAWIRYSHTFAEGATGAKTVTISVSEGEPFVVDGTLDATAPVSEKGFTTSITATKSASSITLELGEESGNGIDIAAGEVLNAFFTVHPVDLTGKTITFTVKNSEGNVLVSNDYYGVAIKRNGVKKFVDDSVKPNKVATVDGVAYATIKDAIDNVAEGGTITLLANVQDESIFVAKGEKNFTFDLDGHTFTASYPLAGSTGTQNQALHLEAGNTITIKNGTIKAIDGVEKLKFIIQNYANLTLEDVTIDAGNLNYPDQVCYALSNNCGNVLLTGNTSIINVPEGAIAMDACKYSSYEKPTVTMSTTGTINGTIELSGGDLVLGADLNVTKPITGNYSGVSDVNLAGHTLTAPKTAILNDGKASLTIHDGNIVSKGLVGVMVNSNTNTTLTSCNVTGVEGAVATGLSTGAVVNINGGTYTATDNAVIAGNGSKRDGEANKITIEAGTFKGQITTKGYIACGIYAPWKDIITVNGGDFEITNGVGVLCRGGKVTIKGGTFTTTDPDSKKGCVGDSRIVVPCQTVYVDKASQYPDYENATIEISGGSFSDDEADDYLEQTYTLNLSKGLYNVVKNRVYVGGKEYDTLQTAIEAATDGQKITFYNNVKTAAFEIPKEKNVVFAMNGKTVTVKGNKTGGGIIVNGNLTITGYRGFFGDPTGESVGYLFNINDGASVTIDTDNDVTFKCGLSCAQMQGNTAKLIINGGNWIGGEYKGKFWTLNKIDAYKESQIIIKGGKFYKFNPAESHTEDPAENWLADGYTAVQNGDWYEVITTIENNTRLIESALSTANSTAVINENVEVTTISDMGTGATIELSNDAVITGHGIGNNGDLIQTSRVLNIKGNGKLVADMPNSAKQSSVVRVGGGTVNIYDGVTLEGGSGNEGNYAVRIVKGTVNIYGGYFHSSNNSTTKEGTSEVIYLESGKVTSNKCVLNVYDGVFETDGDASYLINCQDIYRSKCTVKIMGGIFVGFNPADNTAEGANTNFLADGYVSKEITYNGKQAWEVTKAE